MAHYLRSLVLASGLATGLTALFLTLTPSKFPLLSSFTEIYLETQARSLSVLVRQADRLLQQADKLAESPSTLLEALPKYREALTIYDELRDETKVKLVREKFEAALVAARPLLAKQEAEIQKDSDRLFKRYPKQTSNDTAKKLKAIALSKLAISISDNASEKLPPQHQAQARTTNAIVEPLRKYIQSKVQNPEKFGEPIPENLRKFLTTNAAAIAEIRDLLLKGEIPQWEMDLTPIQKGDFTVPLPAYLGLVTMNNLLLLDAIDNFQNYRTKEGLESFDAAWRLRTSLNGDPRLISQLVNTIITRNQVGILRNLDGIPPEWQKRILQFDRASAFLTSIEMESFSIFAGSKQISQEVENTQVFLPALQSDLKNWSLSMRLDYSRWYINNLNLSARKLYRELPKVNVCNGEIKAAIAEETTIADGGLASPDWVIQWVKGKKVMLQLELTEKVLGVRELVAQSKLPESIPSVPSVACPTNQWKYTVSPEKVTIALTPEPVALNKTQDDLPYSYSILIKSPRE